MTIQKNVYNTSQDERGYISVFEFTSNNGTIVMWDSECGYVNWTSIRKAMGWSKRGEGRNIMKEMEYVEKTAKDIRKIRGGILKIQGTWIPFDDAYEAAKEYCWDIRYELVQIFGEQFVKEARPKTAASMMPTKRRMSKANRNHHLNQKYNVAELTPPPSDIDNSSSASSSNVSTASTTPVSNSSRTNKYAHLASAAAAAAAAAAATGTSGPTTTTTRKRRTSTSEETGEKKRRRSHLKVMNNTTNSNANIMTNSNANLASSNGPTLCIGPVHIKNIKTTLKNTIANKNSSASRNAHSRNSSSNAHLKNNSNNNNTTTTTTTTTSLKNSLNMKNSRGHHGAVPSSMTLSAAPNTTSHIMKSLKSSANKSSSSAALNTNTSSSSMMMKGHSTATTTTTTTTTTTNTNNHMNSNTNANGHHRSDWEVLQSNAMKKSNSNTTNGKVHVNLTFEAKQIYEAVETALALQTLSMDIGMRPFPSWMNVQNQTPEYKKKCLEYPKLTYPSEFEMAGCRFEMVEGCYQKVC